MIFVFLIFSLITSQTVNEEKPFTVYVKQTGDYIHTGTAIGQEKKSMRSAYNMLGYSTSCKIYVVNDKTAFTAEAITFSKTEGITIEGISSDGNGNTIVAINCYVNPQGNLFTCDKDVEYKPAASGIGVDYCLVDIGDGNLYMNSVECIDKCQSEGYGTIEISSCNSEITFTVGNGGVASFISCIGSAFGGIYLNIPNITSASQLKWPTDGTNLDFQNCKVGEGASQKNTAIYLKDVNDELIYDMAYEMKASFAANYTRENNLEYIICESNNTEIDIVSKYYGTITTSYVKSGAENGDGLSLGSPKNSLKEAYNLFAENVNYPGFNLKIVESNEKLKAEQVTFHKRKGITIEGINSNGSENAMVSMDCDVNAEEYLFTCESEVEFKFLAFHLLISLSDENIQYHSLMCGNSGELIIKNCQFIRPPTNGGTLFFSLVYMNRGNLFLDSVECVDESQTVSFCGNVFFINYPAIVSLTNVSLNKISSGGAIVGISGSYFLEVAVNNCTFIECQAKNYGIISVSSNDTDCTYTVGDGGVTSFTSCSSSGFNAKSGGIYLDVYNIESASQLKWPTNGRNLVFQDCFCGEGQSKRNTGLYISLKNDSLFKDMADSIKESFADDFTREDSLWLVVGYDYCKQKECDFVSTFFDPIPQKPDNMTRAFVKYGGKGNGISVESATNSLKDAYEYLEKRGKCFIDVVKTDDPIKAEAISFSINSGITIEGVNDNGEGNTEVAIDCDASASYSLFFCKKTVEFKYLAFQISSTTKNWNSLICAGYDSISLKISTCRFVRIGSQSQEGMNSNADGNSPLASSLVSVTSGSVEMDTVKCTDETSFVAFSSSPFSFSGAREVSLKGMDISKVNVESGAAISIRDKSDLSSKMSIEGLNMNEVISEKGAAAGLDIILSSKESRVAIGRSSKCSFKSCSAPEGKSGAIFIDMPKATSNLKLPTEHNLEIDSSNTAGSKTTSLFIIAPDFEEFCRQEDVFAFANEYDDSTVGWIEGAKDAESDPEDVYEKYVKVRQEKLKEQNKKRMAGIVVAIVVPIVVVAAVVVIVIVVVVVRKRKS
ncbi:uncharacterized protein MONOS_4897 [Monocercomonoides exilis]|uniref:uncharacterized protein n=1 Tax=Monocercomonoides exilis TaxID=2049356 RepID=UPI00355A07EA|nr:hypothetical protein MONOS_4897 [Monocercomonoides exilis]|eukprot:MONOS_4897.1-p1 / transcript=MONOS_4897.1 / gene=MONOS_4897 / organism=Monocercomonoides_exilis_PA203 / gene_product=unspecified product / transcript_product=unspecified product / location=Mono_scaffold00137:12858-16316(-) / protein_length=1061 / sequence_SO=supercontig / SO=protein_coding / is_pseudo=false